MKILNVLHALFCAFLAGNAIASPTWVCKDNSIPCLTGYKLNVNASATLICEGKSPACASKYLQVQIKPETKDVGKLGILYIYAQSKGAHRSFTWTGKNGWKPTKEAGEDTPLLKVLEATNTVNVTDKNAKQLCSAFKGHPFVITAFYAPATQEEADELLQDIGNKEALRDFKFRLLLTAYDIEGEFKLPELKQAEEPLQMPVVYSSTCVNLPS